jgi:3D (Asp-Asp-Asp) domain-containing protein
MAVLLTGFLILAGGLTQGGEPECYPARITGYVRGAGSSRTYDGTSVWSYEPIVAASWDVPIDSTVVIDGLGVYRVADRGRLGPRHLDVLVDTRTEAYALTGVRDVCIWPPE